ncbi:hypothetical protein MHYP_G00068390 [Metynnis hypsauchen]
MLMKQGGNSDKSRLLTPAFDTGLSGGRGKGHYTPPLHTGGPHSSSSEACPQVKPLNCFKMQVKVGQQEPPAVTSA